MIRDILQNHLIIVLSKLGFPDQQITLDHPALPEHGDFATSVALKLPQKRTVLDKKQNPRETAVQIVDQLQKDEELKKYVSKIEIAGPGFINFWLAKEYLATTILRINEVKNEFGKSEEGKDKTVLIEFGQPNTHKLPHIGHFRSYSLGESLSRILEFSGYKLIRSNYQGDVGLHVAKCLWGWTDLKLEESSDLSENIHKLQKAYEHGSAQYDDRKEEVDQINKQIYEKNSEIISLWEKTRNWSLAYYEILNKRLGTSYTKQYFESQTADAGRKVVEENIGQVFEKSEGAIVFPGEKYGLHTRVFITQNNNPTYEAKDLGLVFLKSKDYTYDLSLIATASEQIEYFKVVYKAASLIAPELARKFHHIPFGMVTLKGAKLSSRNGNIVSIEQLLSMVEQSLVDIMIEKEYEEDKIHTSVEILTIAAAKYAILKNDPTKNIVFDLKETVAIEGNSGPYLLYTYARCRSVAEKAGESHYEIIIANCEFNEEELSLLRTLYKFPEVVADAGKMFAPSMIANYLYDIAQKYNLFYQKVPILNSIEKEKQFRLVLTAATAQVLKNGLNLLGIPVLERM